MTEIKQYANEADAYIAKGALESYGIKAMVQVNALSTIFPAPGSGTGSILLFVPDNDVDKALEILDK